MNIFQHFSSVLTGGYTNGPKTELFERLKSILEKKINYDNLKRFDSEKKLNLFWKSRLV